MIPEFEQSQHEILNLSHIFVAASTVEKLNNVRKSMQDNIADPQNKISENKSRKLDQKLKKRIDEQTLFRIIRMFDV